MLFVFLFFVISAGISAISPKEAAEKIGETVTVCGRVAGAEYKPGEKGRPTFLDFSAPHPANVFTAVIWGADRDEFEEPPEKMFFDENVCVSGEVRVYREVPHIFVYDSGQIGIQPAPETMTKEEFQYYDIKDYHEYFYKRKEIAALKKIFKALGYAIVSGGGGWTEDIYNAVFAFQKKNSVKNINGKLTRKMLFILEENINKSEELKYRQKVKYFNMLQPIIARKPPGMRNYEDR